jgi:putative DNA primase/helicase
MRDPLEQFRAAMAARDLIPPTELIADGRIHRCDAEGKNGKDDGAYLLHLDCVPAGGIENHRDGLGWQNWRADLGRKLTPAEEAAHRAKIETAREERDAEDARLKVHARAKAESMWAEATPCEAHPYPSEKRLSGSHGAKLHGDKLVIPMRDETGVLQSLQLIDAEGNKRFLHGGRIKGCYYGLGRKPEGALIVCEGFATGASIHEATGLAVAVAFNAGNLLAVAQAMRSKFPNLRIIIAADDDYETPGNPGLSKALATAQAIGGYVAVPDFGAQRPERATDMNDLHKHFNLEAVRRSVDAAKPPDEITVSQSEVSATEPKNRREDVDERVLHLSQLSVVDYDRTRVAEANALGIRSVTLDGLVRQARADNKHSDGMDFEEVEPWDEPIDPGSLLTELSSIIRRFIICPEETADAAALWSAMTWFMDVVQVAPIAVITAPEKRCGKSQLLFLLGRLVNRPLAASNITPAALFRAVDAWKPTLLIDEADAFMRDNDELRGLLNCGHTRDSAYIVRVVGDDHTPKRFNAWGAKVLAGIGHLADTIMDRAVVLELRRKLPHEEVERLRHAEPGLFDDLAAKLARFAVDYREAVRMARPELPSALNDRAQDNWEPLLAIAGVAGGQWPERAKQAALHLSECAVDGATVGNELLADIQEVFATRNVQRIKTTDLIDALCEDEEKSWATYNRGERITPRQVANHLKEYGIASKNIRMGELHPSKGFERIQFEEAFLRYLATHEKNPLHHYKTPNASINAVFGVADDPLRSGTENLSATVKPSETLVCSGVADKAGKTANRTSSNERWLSGTSEISI